MKISRARLDTQSYQALRRTVLQRDGWRCQNCGATTYLEVHHQRFRSHMGNDDECNLVTLCHDCHSARHRLP
jgi:5-methylcytosine-specific restriction endonuclease McrA